MDGIVMTPPGFGEHLGLGEAVDHLPVEQFVAAAFSKASRARCREL